jgi:hypothetical protein
MGHYSFWLCAIATLLSLLNAYFPAAFQQGLSSKDQASAKGQQRGAKPSSLAARLLADIRGGISAATGERGGGTTSPPLSSIGEQGAALPTAAAAKLADIQAKLTSTWANFSKALGKGRGMGPSQPQPAGPSGASTATAAPAKSVSGELPPPGLQDVQPGTAKSGEEGSADGSHHTPQAPAGEEPGPVHEADGLMRVVSSGSSVVGDMVLVDSASLPAEGGDASSVTDSHPQPMGRAPSASADGTLGRASSAGTGAATPHSSTQQFVHVLDQQLQQCYAQVGA